jgi:Tol biopolymer transport system component
MVSHFIWRDPKHILAWSTEPEGNFFHLYEDKTKTVETVGAGVLTVDGHCTYSPDGQWILTDTYPDRERMQNLVLFRPEDGTLVSLGRFYQERPTNEEWRCDLHPRWSRDGRYVCIDSKCSGQRQMYLLDVSEITLPSE